MSEKKSQHQLQVSTCVCAYVYPHTKTCMYMHTYDSRTHVKKSFVFMFMSYTGVQSFFLMTSLSVSVLQVVLASKSMLGSVPHSRMQKKNQAWFLSQYTKLLWTPDVWRILHTPESNHRVCNLSRVCSDSAQLWHCLLGDHQIPQVEGSVPNIIPLLVQMPSPSLFYQGFQQTSCRPAVLVFFFPAIIKYQDSRDESVIKST